MQLKWKDISSWSRSDTDRTPKTWMSMVGRFRAVVTRRHALDGWYVEFAENFGYRRLKANDIDEAKQEATLLIYEVLQDALRDIQLDGNSQT